MKDRTMTQVVLTDAAIRHLATDPKLDEWKKEKADLKVPILGYYQRSYFKSNDGDITEFGDGFMLTFDSKDIDWAGQGLKTETVLIARDLNILVVGSQSIFASDFTIDWNQKKYTYNSSPKEKVSASTDRCR